MAMRKKFNENFKYVSIPTPMLHNIARGTDKDITKFWLNLYAINAMHRKKQFYNKNFSLPMMEVFHNTPIPYTTLQDYKEGNKRYKILDCMMLSKKSNRYFFWINNRSFDSTIDRMIYKVGGKDLSIPTEEEISKGYKTSYYAYKADRHFSGYTMLSKDFFEIMNVSIKPSSLRVLCCIMAKVVNPKPGFFPVVDMKDLSMYTGFKPYKVLEILKELYKEGFIVCEYLDIIKKKPQVIYMGKNIDPTAQDKIKDYLEMETAQEFDTLTGIPNVSRGDLNELI